MPKHGVAGEFSINTSRAADGRHQPFITTATLPAAHPALPAGTILKEGAAAGTADLAAPDGEQALMGVLDEAVEAGEGVGNVIIHGSCPAEILVTSDARGETAPASEGLIKALRGIGIYA
jgi:hypothetical protein